MRPFASLARQIADLLASLPRRYDCRPFHSAAHPPAVITAEQCDFALRVVDTESGIGCYLPLDGISPDPVPDISFTALFIVRHMLGGGKNDWQVVLVTSDNRHLTDFSRIFSAQTLVA